MLDKTTKGWQTLATQLNFEGRAFINGRYVDALSGQTRTTVNPANGDALTEVASCGIEDAEVAVRGARAALKAAPGRGWRRWTAKWCWFAGPN